jgi:hypothetical protein
VYQPVIGTNRDALDGARDPKQGCVMRSRLQIPAGRSLVTATFVAATLVAATLAACGSARTPAPATAPATAGAAASSASRCFLTTRLKGALDAAVDWQGGALLCEGGARPEGRGLRASFAGKGPQGESLRFVFGLAATPGEPAARNVPTHLTLIVEGSGALYSTQGDTQCATESLEQQPLAGQPGQWRVRARGYCIDPAITLDASARLYVERFDFEGQAHFDPEDLHAARTP